MACGLKANDPLGTNVAMSMMPEQMLNWRLQEPISIFDGSGTERNRDNSPSDPRQAVMDVPVSAKVIVEDSTQDDAQYCVHGYVRRVQESHDSTEGGDVSVPAGYRRSEGGRHSDTNWRQLTITSSSEGGLNVGSQRTITGGPTIGDGNESCSSPPGPTNVLLGDSTVEGQSPNNVESKGIYAEPRHLFGGNLNDKNHRGRAGVGLPEW